MRVGIFGGTFDPIHHGHLILAEQAREQAQLHEVWFLPAPRPPQKDHQVITRLEQRVEMLQLAMAGQPAFRIDELEKERPGPSFTVDTLTELHQRHRGHDFWLLLGGDALGDLPAWREPARIVQLAGLIVMARPGALLPSASELHDQLRLPANILVRLEVLHVPLLEISSHDLRQRIAEGRSIRYFLPRAVEVYIQEKQLYRR